MTLYHPEPAILLPVSFRTQGGFCLTELLISALILVLTSLAVFEMLDTAQRAASYQVEMHAVMDNSRSAIDNISRILRQAGNSPAGLSLEGISIIDSSTIRVRSDLTGSLGPGSPDKGDPDGDIDDSGEDVVVRYNSTTQCIELVPNGGAAQTIACSIASLSFQYRDESGTPTNDGSVVREISVELTGAGTVPDPKTGRIFRMPLRGIVRPAARS